MTLRRHRRHTIVKLDAASVNIEVGAMRAVLKAHELWEPISDGIEMLRERRDVGRALSYEEENRLIEAAGKSRSPALLPLLVITLDTGLRAAEIRSLRCNDLSLVWKNAVVESGFITVPKSKTEAGTGRTIPLSRLPALRSRSAPAVAIFRTELGRLPFPAPFGRCARPWAKAAVYKVQLDKPIGEWRRPGKKRAQRPASATAGMT